MVTVPARSTSIVCFILPACAVALTLPLAGCGRPAIPNQTLVTGKGFEITIQELEQILRSMPPVRKEEVAPTRRRILDLLIDQKLLAQAGETSGLDKHADVVQELASTRRVILANAYIKQLLGDRQPTAAEIKRYYDTHQAIFASRMQFTVHEYALPFETENLDHYADTLNRRGFAALSSEMSSALPLIAASDRTLFSSDLPPGAGEAAATLKPGGDVAYRTPAALHLGQVQTIRHSPVTLADARDRIVGLLLEERRTEIIAAAVKDLRRSKEVRIVNPDLAVGAAK